MKKTVLLLMLAVSIFACKEESKKETVVEDVSTDIKETTTGIKQIKGEFIYYADAAVLQTSSEVYGVVIDSMMHVLQDQVKAYKKETTDMVPVAIRGEVSAKPEGEEGWPYNVKVLEVLKVYKPQAENNNVIKIEKQKK
jgi:hypothetical protein